MTKSRGIKKKVTRTCVATRTKRGVFMDSGTGKRVPPVKALRMHSIGVSPSFTDVCVLSKDSLPLQATAVDGKGGIQYFYSKRHKARSLNGKAARVGRLASRIGHVRRKFYKMLRSNDHKELAIGLCMIMMDRLGFRPGRRHYVRKNATFGATVLIAKKHFKIKGDTVHFSFPGKDNVKQRARLQDEQFAAALNRAVKTGPYFKGGPAVDAAHPRRPVLPSGIKLKDLRTLAANRMLIELAIKESHGMWHGKDSNHSTFKPPEQRVKQLAAVVAKRIGHTYHTTMRSYMLKPVLNIAMLMLVGDTFGRKVLDVSDADDIVAMALKTKSSGKRRQKKA